MLATALDLCSLIEQKAPTRLVRVARSHGGEYAGPCPWCHGTDRFRVWPGVERPHYWCRQCGQQGDAISFLRNYDQLSYRQALEYLGLQEKTYSLPPTYMTYSHAPGKKWQETGGALCHASQQCLWGRRGEAGLAYLRGRGLSDATIREAMLGYSPGLTMAGETWGIQTHQVVIPKGIVIPWYHGGELWKITLRLGKSADHRYEQVLGSQECLYNNDHITRAGNMVVLYEGVFDALSGQQVAPEFAHVATDDVQKCRSARWIVKLCMGSRVLVAYDADEAGDEASKFWTRTLSHAVRLRPWAKDVNAMLVEGQDILEWLVLGLA